MCIAWRFGCQNAAHGHGWPKMSRNPQMVQRVQTDSVISNERHSMSGFRYVILITCTLFITCTYSNYCAFSFTIICQQSANSTARKNSDYFLDDEQNAALMFTATAIGLCVGPLPLYFNHLINTRILIAFYGILSTLSAALYPWADTQGFWPSFACRFAAGFGMGSQVHFANDVVMRWTPENEATLFFAILLSTSQLAPFLTMLMGGEICTSELGWPYLYYIVGLLSALTTFIYLFFYTESLEQNRFLSDTERELIQEGKSETKDYQSVPIWSLVTDRTVLGSLILYTGYFAAMAVYQQFNPTFLKQVLLYSVRESGYYSAFPMLLAIFIKVGSGKAIDHGMGLRGKWRLAVPSLIIEGASAAAIFLCGIMANRAAALVFNLLFACFHSAATVICSRSIQIRARQHAHFALNISVIMGGVSQIISPLLVVFAAPDNTRAQWARIFTFTSLTVVVSTVLYVVMISGDAAPWTKSRPSAISRISPIADGVTTTSTSSHDGTKTVSDYSIEDDTQTT